MSTTSQRVSRAPAHHLPADVLVIGGGPAGTWAALSARARGAERTVLVGRDRVETAFTSSGRSGEPPESSANSRARSPTPATARFGSVARWHPMAG